MRSGLSRALVFGLVAAGSFWATHPALGGFGDAPGPAGGAHIRHAHAELAVMWRSVRAGELPLWNPYEHGGISFLSQAASAMFDPLRWLTTAFACLVGGTSWSLVLAELTARVALGGAGWAAFLRERGVPTWAQVWMCLAWVLSPRFVALHDTPVLASAMWMGWGLWALERVLRRPSLARGACCGAIAASLWHGGAPGDAVTWAIVGGGYGLARAVVLRGTWQGTSPWRAGLAALGVFALLCAGRALTVGEELVRSTAPSVTSMWRGVASLWGAQPVTGGVDLDLGSVGVFGLTLALLCRRREALAWLASAVLLGFAAERWPHVEPAACLVLALAATWGLAELEWTRGNEARAVPVVLALGGTSAGVMLATDPGTGRLLLAAASAAILIAAFATPGWRRFGLALLPVLAALELLVHTRARPPSQPRALDLAPAKVLRRALAEIAGDIEVYRVADLGWSGLRVGPIAGMRDLAGPSEHGLDPRYAKVMEVAQHSATLLGVLNVAVVGLARPSGAVAFGTEPVRARQGLHRVESPWPMAFWTTEIRVVPDLSGALIELMEIGGERRAVFEAEAIEAVAVPPSRPRDAVARSRVELVRQQHARLVFTVEADAPGVLVVAERYADGWLAEVDGAAAPLLRVNAILRAVPLAPGHHEVVMRYAPTGQRFAWWLWVCTWVGLGGWAVVHVRRARAKPVAGGS